MTDTAQMPTEAGHVTSVTGYDVTLVTADGQESTVHCDPGATVLSAVVQVSEEELYEIIFQGTQQEFPGLLAKTIRRHGWHLLNLETGSCYPPMPVEDDD